MSKLFLTMFASASYITIALAFPTAAHADRITDHEQSCQDGDAIACHLLGMIFEHGEGLVADIAKASDYYTAACSSGFSFSCHRLAMLTARDLPPPYSADTLKLLVTSCAQGIAASCFTAAKSFAVTGGDEPAGILMSRACDLGYAEACTKWFR